MFRFRIFNVQQKADAMLGYPAVRRVEYDPSINPTRLVKNDQIGFRKQQTCSIVLLNTAYYKGIRICTLT